MNDIKTEYWTLKSLLFMLDAACSVRWSLMHWYIKKLMGKEMAKQLASLALPKTRYFREQIWQEIRQLPAEIKMRLIICLIHKKTRRKFLQQEKRRLLPRVNEMAHDRFFQEFKRELLGESKEIIATYEEDRQTIGELIYPELQCDIETLSAESWRAGKAFPIEILNSPREEQRLLSGLPNRPGSYNEQILSFLWQLGNNPYLLKLPQPRRNDLLFEKVEQRPSDSVTGKQVVKALGKLFLTLSEERTVKILFKHGMARILRHNFALSKGRDVISFSEVDAGQKLNQEQEGKDYFKPWEPEDTNSMHGYEEVDYRMEYEAIRNQLPSKQKEAFDIYFEHFQTGKSIESICLEKGLDSATVRNNFQAIKGKASKLNSQD